MVFCWLLFILNVTGEGNGNPLQYSCLDNPMDKGAWRAIFRGVAKSWTRTQVTESKGLRD